MPARILIAEDNSQNAELMAYLLQAFGHRICTAADGQACLDWLARESFDLLLLDLQMPILDGYQVLARVKAEPAWQDMPVLAVTALAMLGQREQALRAGFDGYIPKPIEPEKFLALIDDFLPAALHSRPPEPEPAAERSPLPDTAAERSLILLVDDLPDNLELLRTLLENQGYRVITADSVQSALSLARQLPDLVLTDLQLRDEDSGFQLVEAIKTEPSLAALPVLVLSSVSWDLELQRRQARSLGARDLISRPLEPAELLREIQRALAD